MPLDIATPLGQATLEHERRSYELFTRGAGQGVIVTPKDRPGVLDGFVVRNGEIVAGIEQKSRDCTLGTLVRDYGYEWLITASKLERARDVCAALCVPLYGFLYLVPQGMLLVKTLSHASGEWACDVRFVRTTTQRTVNGGSATRLNAFVAMAGAWAY